MQEVDSTKTASSGIADGTLFGLIRHGQTEWNVHKKLQGRCDSPLTAQGKVRAGKWGAILQQHRFTMIVSSPQARALHTARIINETLQLPLETDARFREQSWGDWEGLTLQDINERFSAELSYQVTQGWHFAAPGGETRLAVYSRVFAALSDAAAQWPDERILLVCHQGVIKALLYRLNNRSFLPDEKPLLRKDCLHLVQSREARLSPVQINIPLTEKE